VYIKTGEISSFLFDAFIYVFRCIFILAFILTIFSMLLQKHKNTMFFSNKMLQLCLNKNEIIVNKL
jgi:hypothetical protein